MNALTRMRNAAAVILALPLAAAAQSTSDGFAMTQRFAAAGAPHVALARIESLQPASPSAARWGEWEQLRCTLMQRLNRHRALIERVAAMPPNAPAQAQRACLAQGARAANAI